jgi:hypothetical protein
MRSIEKHKKHLRKRYLLFFGSFFLEEQKKWTSNIHALASLNLRFHEFLFQIKSAKYIPDISSAESQAADRVILFQSFATSSAICLVTFVGELQSQLVNPMT